MLAGLRGTSVAIIVAANLETPTPSPSPTPRPTPTTTPFPLPTSGLTFTILVDPPQPAVGDTVTIRVRASGEGRAPRYTLEVRGATSALLLESPASVPAGGLGTEVGWTLRAAGPGTAILTVGVAYEQLVRLSDGTFRFRAAAVGSGAVTVTIAESPTATPSPVPSPTPLPTAAPTPVPTPRPTPVPTKPPAPTATPPGQPNVLIASIFFDGVAPGSREPDEYVEIINRGDAGQDLAGWSVRDIADGTPVFVFPSCVLGPDERVRVYTNEVHPEWGGFSFERGSAVWNNCNPDMAGLFNQAGVLVSTRTYAAAASCY